MYSIYIMQRILDFGNSDFGPLINDLIKGLTTLLVVEVLLYYFNKDPLMDKVFVRMTMYNMIGLSVYYMVTNKLVGSGPTCCTLR